MIVCLACFEDRLASLFENAASFRLFDVTPESQQPAGELAVTPGDAMILAQAMVSRDAALLVCGGISVSSMRLLTQRGIAVHPWISGCVETVLDACARDALDTLTMPGAHQSATDAQLGFGSGRGMGGGGGRGMGGGGRGASQAAPQGTGPGLGLGPCGQGQRRGQGASQNTLATGPAQPGWEGTPMKIAISSTGPDMTSAIDERFGRAPGFVIVDLETGDAHFLDNTAISDLAHGAGIQAAQSVAKSGATAIVTGRVGPKAETALNAGKITIYLGAKGTVGDTLESFKRGDLRPSS